MGSIVNDDRASIRKNIRKKRQALTSQQQQLAADQAADRLIEFLLNKKITKLALYITHDGELDTAVLIAKLWQMGVEVYLPILHPFCSGHLLFQKYSSHTPMQSNQFGILEPKLNVSEVILPSKLDAIVTPLVAFDVVGNRMGMGGGYYDRTFAMLENKNSVLRIGYAHDCQRVDKLPVKTWDMSLHLIVTPKRCYLPITERVLL
ncbi:MAG: 5-formyltetrahydrofolate cyclo-ligase [Parashewanella sp.]